MSRAEAYSPCCITGFFRIYNQDPNPLRIGSTGASVALVEGVTTRVELRQRASQRIHVAFNGNRLSGNSVSAYLARKYLELDGRGWDVNVSHSSKLPAGRGYGTSGAGALSLSYALNDAMGLSLSKIEAAQMAHLSEISSNTGLGTVLSAFFGGLNLRTEPGAPGFGKVARIPFSPANRLVTTSFAPIVTKRVLRSHALRSRVNDCSSNMVNTLRQNKALGSFMRLSRRFAECMALRSQRVKRLMDELDSIGILSSMAMLGQTLFCIVPYGDTDSVNNYLRRRGSTPIITEVSTSGARLL